MSDKIARVWSGSEWISITSPASAANAIAYYQATAPSSPVIGQLWLDTATDLLKAYNGSTWQSVVFVDLSSYTTTSDVNTAISTYVSNPSNIPALNSTQVPTVSINNQSGNYTLVLSDAGKVIYMSSSSAASLTIPLHADVSLPVGTKIDAVRTGTGEITVAVAGGITLNSEGSKKRILDRWCGISLIKTNLNEWTLLGALKT